MATSPPAGLYRIQTVAEITGVPAATLRAWERRYGVPAPARTASAYRLYSESDVALITRMRDRVAAGVAAAEAAAEVLALPPSPPEAPPQDVWAEAAAAIVAAAERFEQEALEEAVRRALPLGPAAVLYERIFGPALRAIGDGWHEGRLSVAQEHLATQVLEGAVRVLLGLVQPTGEARTVLLGCLGDETHTLGLYGAAFHFASWGYRTVMLGARTPPDAVADAVERLEPAAVGLSATVPLPRAAARRLLADYAAACGETPWLVGGPAASSLRSVVEELGGLCIEAEAAGARRALEARRPPRRRR